MLKNYLLTAWRNINRNKGYSLVNIFGLAIGFAMVLLIGIFVVNEVTYDLYNKNVNTIYRLAIQQEQDGKSGGNFPITSPPMAPAVVETYPEAINYVRFKEFGDTYFFTTENSIHINHGYYCDTGVFSIFSYDLVQGKKDEALFQPYTIVLTESTAGKLFGKRDRSCW